MQGDHTMYTDYYMIICVLFICYQIDDPDKQRKWEEREQRRQMKRRAPKMKQLKVKMNEMRLWFFFIQKYAKSSLLP